MPIRRSSALCSGVLSLPPRLARQGTLLEEAFFDLTRNETDYHAGQLAGATQGA
jgi:hypothetical protein